MDLIAKKLKRNNMEKTAVEWLVNELKNSIGFKDLHTIEKAKQMFEQQIINSYNHMRCIGDFENGKQYYNETFKTK